MLTFTENKEQRFLETDDARPSFRNLRFVATYGAVEYFGLTRRDQKLPDE